MCVCVCVCVPHLLYSSIEGHSGFFHILAIVNNAAVNTGEHVSLLLSVLGRCGYIPRRDISRSCSSCIFSILRNLPYCSPQWLRQLIFPPTVYRGSLFSTPLPAGASCSLFDDGHSDRCEVTSVILIYIPPMASDAEYLFTCLSAIRM